MDSQIIPPYAEQWLNRLFLVEVEMEMEMEMELVVVVGVGKDGWARAKEVERRVTAVMESEEGDAQQNRKAEMKEKAMAAPSEVWSFVSALTELVELWYNIVDFLISVN